MVVKYLHTKYKTTNAHTNSHRSHSKLNKPALASDARAPALASHSTRHDRQQQATRLCGYSSCQAQALGTKLNVTSEPEECLSA